MNRQITTLAAPEFSDDERAQLVTHLMALKKVQIQGFLIENELAKSGTKPELQSRIEEAIVDGALDVECLVRFLDEVTPWGTQHVFLYRGPTGSIAEWKKPEWVADLLKRHRLGKYLNATLPLALPDKMRVSSIVHDGRRLRITAIKKREWTERNPAYDETKRSDAGEMIELRAFVHRVTRGLVAFEWDLSANTAFLQISQLPRHSRYEEVAEEFIRLIGGWLDISRFPIVDLRPPIRKLHELEENGTGEIRSHSINYRTLQGRRLEGTSASPADPLLGEPIVDAALAAVRNSGVGHSGNFYWLASGASKGKLNGASNGHASPLITDVHVVIIAYRNRINFPTPNDERTVRHVLSRIRSHCA